MKKTVILKHITLFLLLIILLFLSIAGFITGEFLINVRRVNPSAEHNFYWPYMTYTSPYARKLLKQGKKLTLLVIPNNTGKPSDTFQTHIGSAKRTAFLGRIFFRKQPVIMLVPIFPRTKTDSHIYSHALDRDTLLTGTKKLYRIDLQLLAMAEDVIAGSQNKSQIEKKIALYGFSASGMFVNRFTLLHPHRIKAAVIGSPGGWPIAPVRDFNNHPLRYPIGISDFEEITGRPADIFTFSRVPQLFFIGSQDTNDSVPYSDSFDEADKKLIFSLFGETPVSRWKSAESIYRSIHANSKFIKKEGVTHNPVPFMKEVNLFLKKHL